jgi:hypothetical protein
MRLITQGDRNTNVVPSITQERQKALTGTIEAIDVQCFD